MKLTLSGPTKCVGLFASSPAFLRNEAFRINDRPLGLDEPLDLVIPMPCGNIYRYATLGDVPQVTTACRCGDPNHVVIGYGEE